jgi:hypothetical protein
VQVSEQRTESLIDISKFYKTKNSEAAVISTPAYNYCKNIITLFFVEIGPLLAIATV